MDIDGESGREIRISRSVDLLVFGDEDTRISDRLGEPPEAMVINGDCEALTLIKAKNRDILVNSMSLIDDLTSISLV